MSARFPLQLVLDRVEGQAEALAREVKRSHGVWLLARGREVQLRGARDRQLGVLAAELAPGLAATVLAQRAQFAACLQVDLQRAVAHVDACHAAWQTQLVHWMQANDQVKALKVLQRHHLDARAIQARRSEQREHDELAQNTRFWQQDSEEAV
jgi:flagellar biosynthesis chaperone FliJ